MLIRQPNGKLCMCNWNGEIEKMNLTEEEYIEYFFNIKNEPSVIEAICIFIIN